MLKMKTKVDVSKIMKAKSNLKNMEQYKHVYIEKALSDTEKKTTLNGGAMLKAVGKDKEYIFVGDRLVKNNKHND